MRRYDAVNSAKNSECYISSCWIKGEEGGLT